MATQLPRVGGSRRLLTDRTYDETTQSELNLKKIKKKSQLKYYVIFTIWTGASVIFSNDDPFVEWTISDIHEFFQYLKKEVYCSLFFSKNEIIPQYGQYGRQKALGSMI